jgi:hypothetical protein
LTSTLELVDVCAAAKSAVGVVAATIAFVVDVDKVAKSIVLVAAAAGGGITSGVDVVAAGASTTGSEVVGAGTGISVVVGSDAATSLDGATSVGKVVESTTTDVDGAATSGGEDGVATGGEISAGAEGGVAGGAGAWLW